MKSRSLLIALLGALAFGQSERPLQLTDILAWKHIQTPAVSNDGYWFAYRLAPAEGVTEVTVTTEDEYFPPPPELRELLRAVGATLAFLAGRPAAGRTDPAAEDRAISAADVLDLLAS